MKQSIGSMMFMVGASLTFATLDETNVFSWLIILFLAIGTMLMCSQEKQKGNKEKLSKIDHNSLCETETYEVDK